MTFRTNVIYRAPLGQASAVSLTRRVAPSTSATHFPQEDEKIIIYAGAPYLHVTTTDRWANVDTDEHVYRVPGNVNALGKGFYTYPASEIDTTNGKSLSKLLQWVNFNAEDEEEMRNELKEKVRIVTVRPKYNVRAWKPKILPQEQEITEMENKMSAQNKLDFLAIVDSSSYETAWLKAKIQPQILPEGGTIPTDTQVKAKIELKEDGLPMDWLVKNVRILTTDEIDLYLKEVWKIVK